MVHSLNSYRSVYPIYAIKLVSFAMLLARDLVPRVNEMSKTVNSPTPTKIDR